MNDEKFFEEWEKMYGKDESESNTPIHKNNLNNDDVINENELLNNAVQPVNQTEESVNNEQMQFIDIESNISDIKSSIDINFENIMPEEIAINDLFPEQLKEIETSSIIHNILKEKFENEIDVVAENNVAESNIAAQEIKTNTILQNTAEEIFEKEINLAAENNIATETIFELNNIKNKENNIIMENKLIQASIIKVIGVGGGGGNAVNHMYRSGIEGVEFIVCNTDAKDLAKSPVAKKIQLGSKLTEGRGAGAKPEVGKNAAIENIDEIKNAIAHNTKMVFVTAGMGGGTGTGAAPIIASVAREMGILTVGIVTVPFVHEGSLKRKHAEIGIAEMRKNVDSLIIVCNDKLREMYGSLPFTQAFAKADDILATGAKAIVEIITTTGIITQDFNDVKTVMENSGTAIMGIAETDGTDRAIKVVEAALSSPLLNDNNIHGASQILLNITSGSHEASMDEVAEIQDYIQREAGEEANIILGLNKVEELDDAIKLIIIATGFKSNKNLGFEPTIAEEKKVNILDSTNLNAKLYNLSEPINNNVQNTTPNIAPIESKYNVSDADGFILKKIEETVIENKTVKIENIQTTEPSTDSADLFSTDTVITHHLNEEFISKTIESTVNEEINEMKVENNDTQIPFEVVTTETITSISSSTNYTLENENEELQFSIFTKETTQEEETITKEERIVYDLESNDINITTPAKNEELQARNDDRAARLRNYTNMFKNKKSLSELESEPAYVRNGTLLNDLNETQEQNQSSRYTLSEDENKKTEIRPNNSFLHDNVD